MSSSATSLGTKRRPPEQASEVQEKKAKSSSQEQASEAKSSPPKPELLCIQWEGECACGVGFGEGKKFHIAGIPVSKVPPEVLDFIINELNGWFSYESVTKTLWAESPVIASHLLALRDLWNDAGGNGFFFTLAGCYEEKMEMISKVYSEYKALRQDYRHSDPLPSCYMIRIDT